MAYEMDDTKEMGNLIGSDKVEGTAVYGADQKKIGSIQRVMIEKMSGKVSYVVLSLGGFLGIGDDYYSLPWNSLKYDTSLISRSQIIHNCEPRLTRRFVRVGHLDLFRPLETFLKP